MNQVANSSSLAESESPDDESVKFETNIVIIKARQVEVKFVNSITCDETRKTYKYSCPVCLSYFTHIFESTCCKNYLCF